MSDAMDELSNRADANPGESLDLSSTQVQDIRTEGIVLRVYPLTETSLIAHWITREYGRVSTVAKGARRMKSPFRGKLDLFFLADFSFRRSRHSDLHTLKEVRLINMHPDLRRDLKHLEQASYCGSLLDMALEPHFPMPEAFELLHSLLSWLSKEPARPMTVFTFEIKLLGILGFEPPLDQSPLNEGSRHLLRQCQTGSWTDQAILRPSRSQHREIGDFLALLIKNSTNWIPKGRTTAVEWQDF